MKEKTITLKDIGIKFVPEIHTLDFNGKEISIKTYLPIEETLQMAEEVINAAADSNKFYNPGKLDVAFAIGVIEHYTNIDISAEELEDRAGLYDALINSGLYAEIKAVISDELDYVKDLIQKTVAAIYSYQNSALGVMEAITTDYANVKFDTEEISNNLKDPTNLELLKEVVTKLG